jgi:hypothetical protein
MAKRLSRPADYKNGAAGHGSDNNLCFRTAAARRPENVRTHQNLLQDYGAKDIAHKVSRHTLRRALSQDAAKGPADGMTVPASYRYSPQKPANVSLRSFDR